MTTDPIPGSGERAGRWARLAAVVIDIMLLYWLLRGVEAILLALGVYIPFEATYLASYFVGIALLFGTTGTTPGKWLCGIAVRTRTGEHVGLGRVAFRELVAKSLAVVPLLIGIAMLMSAESEAMRSRSWTLIFAGIAVLFTYPLIGLHDRIAGTMVVRGSTPPWRRSAVAVGLVLPVLLIGGWAGSNLRFYLDVHSVVTNKLADVRFAERDSTLVTDVVTINSTRDGEFVAWLDSNAVSPTDFAIAKCREYPLVLFGEEHQSQDILSFVSDALPRLYREAGVRCLGMETINSQDNEALDRLMAGETFDEALAINIYRNNSWHNWGGRGYVDVLQSAWRINHELAPGESPFRVVGLFERVDLPSFVLAGIFGDGTPASIVERLRAGRAIRDFPRVLLGDVTLAREAERQMLERGERGVVLVGSNHTSIGALAPYAGLRSRPRMGFILHSKYPGDIYQISFSSDDLGALGDLLRRVMEMRGNAPVGFDVRDSPFDLLRASDGWVFRGSPAVAFGDLAAAYVCLHAPGDGTITPWIDGFVTPAMFARYRPFYEADAGKDLRSAADADSAVEARHMR